MLTQNQNDIEQAIAVRAALARFSLKDFIIHVNQQYYAKWFHRDLCYYLDQVLARNLKRLMVFLPNQVGKSETCSRYFPAYAVGKRPNLKLLACSYNDTFAGEFNKDVQRIIQSDAYREAFPEIQIGGKGAAANNSKFEIIKNGELTGGVYRCAGVGGGITGKPCDIGLIDDPIKDDAEAQSETYRNNMWGWYLGDFKARLHNDSAIIVVCTRRNEDDLSGRILARESGWKVLVIPGLYEDLRSYDKLYPPEIRLPTHDPRKEGEALWPRKHDQASYLEMKKNSERLFASMSQQRPAPTAGNMIKRSYIRYYNPATVSQFEEIAQSWDCAFEGKETSNYVACTVWGKIGAQLYLLLMTRGKWGAAETMEQMRRVAAMYPNGRKFVEKKANGAAMLDLLKSKIPGLIPIEVSDSKEKRVYAASFAFEAGNIYFPIGRTWAEETVEELIVFPNGRYDDIVDTVTQAINYFMRQKPQGALWV